MLSISACSVLIFVSAFCKANNCANSAFTLYRLLRYLSLIKIVFMQTNNHTGSGTRARRGDRALGWPASFHQEQFPDRAPQYKQLTAELLTNLNRAFAEGQQQLLTMRVSNSD